MQMQFLHICMLYFTCGKSRFIILLRCGNIIAIRPSMIFSHRLHLMKVLEQSLRAVFMRIQS